MEARVLHGEQLRGQLREQELAARVVAPYVRERYSSECRELRSWIKQHGGAALSPIVFLCDDDEGSRGVRRAFLTLARQVLTGHEADAARVAFARALHVSGEHDGAAQAVERVLDKQPEHAGAQYNKAITLYRVGKHEQAQAALEQARRLDPENALTLAVLGGWRLSAVDCDLDEALSLLYGALDLLERRYGGDAANAGYCSLVAEEVFEALWQRGLRNEAREVARVIGERILRHQHPLPMAPRPWRAASSSSSSAIPAPAAPPAPPCRPPARAD